MRRRTTFTEDFNGVDYEIDYEAVGDILKEKVGDKVVIGYLTYDEDYDDEDYDSSDMMCDGDGGMISFHRSNRDNHAKGLEALGNNSDGEPDLEAVYCKHEAVATDRYVAAVFTKYSLEDLLVEFHGDFEFDQLPDESDTDFVTRALRTDSAYNNWDNTIYDETFKSVLGEMWYEDEFFPGNPDAQLLSVYSHGGEHWSLSGEGMQCQWDTNNSAGVWIPSGYQSTELEKLPAPERRKKAREYAQQFLDTFNEINSGQVFGVVVQTYEEDGTEINMDSCWGFVGSKSAEEALRDDYFKPECERLAKEHEKAVRTQEGNR